MADPAAAPSAPTPAAATPSAPAEPPANGASPPSTGAVAARDKPAATEPTNSILGEPAKTDAPADAKAGDKKDGETPPVAPAAKVEYKDFTLPSGLEVDAATLGEFKTLASELGLSQEAAQKLVDFQGTRLAAIAEAPYNLWRDTQKTWQGEVKADPELGGKNFDTMKSTVAKALDQFGDPKVREALDFTGAGNNPAIIRTMYRMAQKLVETSGPLVGNPPKTTGKTMEEKFYGNSPGAAA